MDIFCETENITYTRRIILYITFTTDDSGRDDERFARRFRITNRNILLHVNNTTACIPKSGKTPEGITRPHGIFAVCITTLYIYIYVFTKTSLRIYYKLHPIQIARCEQFDLIFIKKKLYPTLII